MKAERELWKDFTQSSVHIYHVEDPKVLDGPHNCSHRQTALVYAQSSDDGVRQKAEDFFDCIFCATWRDMQN